MKNLLPLNISDRFHDRSKDKRSGLWNDLSEILLLLRKRDVEKNVLFFIFEFAIYSVFFILFSCSCEIFNKGWSEDSFYQFDSNVWWGGGLVVNNDASINEKRTSCLSSLPSSCSP